MFCCRQCCDKGASTKQKAKTIKSSKKKKQPHRLMPGVEVSHIQSKSHSNQYAQLSSISYNSFRYLLGF